MSGGNFYNLQYRITEIINRIEQEIKDNNAEPIPKEYFIPNNFSEKTITEFKNGIEYIKKAQIYIHRIDYLLSNDDSEDTFHEKLSEDLSTITE